MALIQEYYRMPALSRSAIFQIIKSPAHYVAWAEAQRQTSDMRVGSLVHYMLLCPERLESEIAVHTETLTLESVSGRTFIAKYPDRFCCTKAEWDEAIGIYKAVKANKDAWDLLTIPAKRERLVKVVINGVPCKALIDLSARNLMLDLKTTSKDLGSFDKSVVDYGLDIQAAWYSKLGELADGVKRDFWFLPIEKKKPNGT